MARAGAAVRSIASEDSVAALAAHVSFGRISKGYSESFGHMSNTTKEDLSSGV